MRKDDTDEHAAGGANCRAAKMQPMSAGIESATEIEGGVTHFSKTASGQTVCIVDTRKLLLLIIMPATTRSMLNTAHTSYTYVFLFGGCDLPHANSGCFRFSLLFHSSIVGIRLATED